MPGKDDQFLLTWMPDNRRVLMAIGRGPVRRSGRIDIDTRQTEEVKGLPSEMANMALSPDGRDCQYHVSDQGGGLAVWRVPPTGGGAESAHARGRSAGYLAWSPDGQRIALEVDD